MDGSRLLFSRLGQQAVSSVWVVDPFVLTASLLVDFRFVEVSKQPRFEAKINSGFLFVAADAIWSTDGTREGTKRLGDFDTNRMSLLSSSDSTAFFWRKGPRMEVWSYDGTVGGIHLLTSLESEWGLTNPEVQTFGDGLLLAYEGSLWFIRKGAFDLLLRKSPLSGILVTGTTGMSSAFGKVYFQSYDSILGDVLWETDATVSGTRIVRDSAGQPVIRSSLLSTPLNSRIRQMIGFDGAIYYRGITDRYGIELVRLSSDVLEGVPALLKVIRSKQHVLQWKGVFGAEDYEIELTDLNAMGGVPLVVRVPNNLWAIPTDWDDRSVSIRVRAVLPNGITGEWSSERLVVTLGEVPVLEPMVTPSLNPSPNISWTPVPGTMRTDVWISNLDTKTQIVSTSVTGRVTTYQPPDLPAGRYAVWVRSVADGGLTDWSEVQTFTVLSSPPSIVRIGVQQSGPLTIEWSAVSGADGYEVWVSRQGAGAAVRYVGNTGPVLQWTFADALPGDSYTVWVRALRDGLVFSTWSPGSGFVVASAPVFRSLLPILNWSVVRPAVAYQIRIYNETTGVVFNDRTTSTTLMTAANSPGRYRILIRSEYSDGSTSDWRTAAQEILHPSVQFPTGVVSTVDATPVITWEAFSGVSNYDLEVYRQDSGKRVYLSRGLLGISHRVASVLEAGEYRVWVRGQFADGTRTLWGNGQRLLIGSPPTLVYSSGKLRWSSVSEATRYELEIVMWDSSKQRWDRVLRTDVRNQTEYSVSAFGQGRYRGWVRALRDEAGDSYFSRWSTAADWS